MSDKAKNLQQSAAKPAAAKPGIPRPAPRPSGGAQSPPANTPPQQPTHIEVQRQIAGAQSAEEERKARDARYAELRGELDDDDESEIMFAPGHVDLLCGVVREAGWRYVICTENTATQGKSRPNFTTLLSQGYTVAPLPDHLKTEDNHGLANWPELSKAIMRVPEKRYARWKKWKEAKRLEQSGADLKTQVAQRVTGEGPEKDSYYVEDHAVQGVSASDLGITPSGIAAGVSG